MLYKIQFNVKTSLAALMNSSYSPTCFKLFHSLTVVL